MSHEKARARMMAKVDQRGPDECWVWRGCRNKGGYGQGWVDGRLRLVARYFLEQKLGRPLGAAEFACHSCDNPPCCNPSHLWAGSHQENMADAKAKGRFATPSGRRKNPITHCKRGHPLSGENLANEGGRRRCRACRLFNQRRRNGTVVEANHVA